MAGSQEGPQERGWTAEEVARDERARRIRAALDREKGGAERLEETLRLSRLMGELRQGFSSDVRA